MDTREKSCKEISVYLDRIEELEDGTAEAVLLIDEGEEEYSGEFHLPENFLPEDAEEGNYLTIKIFRNADEIDDDSPKLTVTLKQIEDDALLVDNSENKIYLPSNFLPENTDEGDSLTIEIFCDTDKTNAALDEARQLLKELE